MVFETAWSNEVPVRVVVNPYMGNLADAPGWVHE
jgi:hypothetical protein